MISIIITAFKEPETIGKAISSLINQKGVKSEIIVAAPDKETLEAASKYQNQAPIRLIKDRGHGKSAALREAIRNAKGSILILTDGDVYVKENTLRLLVKPLSDNKIGAVSGRPVSINSKENKFGFWSYILTEVAHKRRAAAINSNTRFFCSGYLFAIRKELFPVIYDNLLAEDGFISECVYMAGKKIGYSAEAEVYVKYPDNFRDWINQKKRSAGGYVQIKKMIGVERRSFIIESFGALELIEYVKKVKHISWLVQLYFARLYLWFLILIEVRLMTRSRDRLWVRIESTK